MTTINATFKDLKFKPLQMKQFITIFVFAVFGLSSNLYAQPTNSAQINASVTIIKPISISRSADINFGKITIAGAGTVVVSTAGTRTQTGGITLLNGGSEAPGLFNVTGQETASYAVTIPTTVVLKKSGSATETITADSFTHNALALSGNTDQLKIGATIRLVGSETVGAYVSDLFAVTVSYN